MEDFKQVLHTRLIKGGADPSSLSSILKALSKLLAADPNIDPGTANNRLRYLGWPEVKVDYLILQLALACFERESGSGSAAFEEDDRRRQAMRLRELDRRPLTRSEI
jgi:hypothetical protein